VRAPRRPVRLRGDRKRVHAREDHARQEAVRKYATIIQGLDGKDIDLKELSSLLKAKCACGGTIKDNTIELQGDHKEKVKDFLQTIGYSSELIDVK